MKPRYAPVSIQERMDPGQAVMGCRRDQQRLYSMISFKTINVPESIKKSRESAFPGPDMAPYLYRPVPNLTRDDLHRFARFIISHETKLMRKLFIEDSMQPLDELRARYVHVRFFFQPFFDSALAFDMGKAFQLQISFGRIGRKVFAHGTFDVDRMSAMALYEVRVIAVGDPQEFRDRFPGDGMKTSGQGRRTAYDLPCAVGKLRRGGRTKRLHLRNAVKHFNMPIYLPIFILLNYSH
jgi:hypothetical protein